MHLPRTLSCTCLASSCLASPTYNYVAVHMSQCHMSHCPPATDLDPRDLEACLEAAELLGAAVDAVDAHTGELGTSVMHS